MPRTVTAPVCPACPSPNAYAFAWPCKMRCSPAAANVDRLKPFFERMDEPPPPGLPLLNLNRARRRGGAGGHGYRLLCDLARVRWRGHASPADAWRRVEELESLHCRDLVAEFEAISPNRRAARSATRRAVLRGLGPGPRPGSLACSSVSGLGGGCDPPIPLRAAELVPPVFGWLEPARSCPARRCQWWAGRSPGGIPLFGAGCAVGSQQGSGPGFSHVKWSTIMMVTVHSRLPGGSLGCFRVAP